MYESSGERGLRLFRRVRVMSHGIHHETDGSFVFRGSSVSTESGIAPGYPARGAEAGREVEVEVRNRNRAQLATPTKRLRRVSMG